MDTRIDLGRVGIWSGRLRTLPAVDAAAAAVEIEQLGFGAVWFPAVGRGIFERARQLLAATDRLVVATGITDIWTSPAALVADSHRSLTDEFPGRFLLGLGVSHVVVDEQGVPTRIWRPIRAMRLFLDELDRVSRPVPQGERVLAALGPQMLALAGNRTAGCHPYLVPPSHTRRARGILGQGPLLAPEMPMVFETDPIRAREIARRHVAPYLGAPNYANNLLREGFTRDDLGSGGSDRLIDAIVAWGDDGAVLAKVAEHFEAGADHICVQVLTADPDTSPLREWQRLAAILPSDPPFTGPVGVHYSGVPNSCHSEGEAEESRSPQPRWV